MAVVDNVSGVALRGWFGGEKGEFLPEMSETTWSNLLWETESGFGCCPNEFGRYGSDGRFGGMLAGSGGSGCFFFVILMECGRWIDDSSVM